MIGFIVNLVKSHWRYDFVKALKCSFYQNYVNYIVIKHMFWTTCVANLLRLKAYHPAWKHRSLFNI